jgi:hypothetical protein
MKTKFLIATALASILASAGIANAQDSHEGGRNAPSASGPAAASAPEHGAPSAPHAQSQSEPKGAMGKPNGAPNNQTGQSESKGSGKADRADVGKSGAPNTSAQTEKKAEKAPSAAQNDKPGAAEKRTNDNKGSADVRSKDDNRNAAENRDAKRPASASLSTEQRTKIRETVVHDRNAPRLARSDINISLNVGVRIPRDQIHIRPIPLPETIVEIEPQWRGFLYFLVDDEVVVVDPGTYEVVAVLPA